MADNKAGVAEAVENPISSGSGRCDNAQNDKESGGPRRDNKNVEELSSSYPTTSGPNRCSGFQFQDIGAGRLFNTPGAGSKCQGLNNFGHSGSSNFQYHQIPIPSPSAARGRGSRDPSGVRGQGHSVTNGVRSRASISEGVPPKGPGPLRRNGSSLSMLIDSDVFQPSSPSCSTKSSFPTPGGSGVGHNGGHQGHSGPYDTPTKPKKWFSFSNLLNRQNLSSLLNLPSKTRLSVSSTLNSVFVGPGGASSPSPSEGGSDGGNVFFGLSFASFDKGGGGGPTSGYPISPTGRNNPSGESQGQGQGQGQGVIFRRKSGSGCGETRERRSSTSTSSSGGCGGPPPFSKHYSSGCESVGSERSSGSGSGSGGIGYYTVNSGGGGCGGVGGAGSGSSGSRLSCGEFFTGTPNSPINSSGGESRGEVEFSHFHTGSGCGGVGAGLSMSMSGFSRGESCSYSARDFYHFHKSLGRSLPTLLESMESGIASQSSSSEGGGVGGGGGSSSYSHTPLSVDSVMDLMYQEFAILTGAKSLDDHYILTFPDRGNFHLLGDEDYKRLVSYLTAVPPMHDAESGFVIVVDRRNDKWNSVKTTLVRISNYFPALIHRVFVLRPVGLFQKALSELSSKLFRSEHLRFRLTVCNSLGDLYTFVTPASLSSDLGGVLAYDKIGWVAQRVEVEAFHAALQTLSRELKGFTESFQDLETPNDPGSTEALISGKHSEFQRLRLDLGQSVEYGEHLLFRIKDMAKGSSEHVANHGKNNGVGSGATKNQNGKGGGSGNKGNGKSGGSGSGSGSGSHSSVQLINVISVERYIIQIEETARLFEEFWTTEKLSLERCLQLRRFEHDFREMQATFDTGMKRLEELGEVGESLTGTEALIRETLDFQLVGEEDVARAQELEGIGREIAESNQAAVDSVAPKCYELSRMRTQFLTGLRDKMSRQKEWREIQAVIERANHLCNEGMDLVSMSISISCQISDQSLGVDMDYTDGSGSGGGGSCGSSLIAKIDDFLERIRGMGEELRNHFKTSTSPTSPTSSRSKPLVKQVLKRVEDVENMCSKRKSLLASQLLKLASTASKPRRSSGSANFGNSLLTPSNHSHTSGHTPELKTAKSTSQLDSSVLMEEYSSPSTSLRSGSSTLSLDGSGGSGSGHSRSRATTDTDWEVKKVKRGHVLNELLQTERTYVAEIGEILAEYRDQISNPEVRSLLPTHLQPLITPTKLQRRNPNVAVLFCNLDEIHAFHSKSFLPDLSNCVESIELVGLCFIQRHSDFLSMYSQYCQLLPASEGLRKEIGENHPWFVSCRNRLGHKLPLGAYLLKPVQRITKYHLLLKDLIKSSEGCEGYSELLEALECMLVVLRCVNDGMHQLGITGYPGKLIEEGYLLLQNSFLLWSDNKKDRLRLKGHSRHLFLYQRSVLITKKVPKSSLYEFRTKLNLAEVGLTEAVKGSGGGSGKKFEIWINGRAKVYLLAAESLEVKEIWVREIKKLLLEQLESIRATKSQTIGACGAGVGSSVTAAAALSCLSLSQTSSAAAARRAKMMGKGITVNGWRSANLGHRALRQVSSWDNPDVLAATASTRPKSRTNVEPDIDEDVWSCSELSNSDDEDGDDSGPATATPTPPSRSRPVSMGEESSGSGSGGLGLNVYNGVGEVVDVEDGPRYLALADYGPMGPAEVGLKEGDVVTLVKVGCGGWWFVKILHTSGATLGPMEGWAPAAYLEKFVGDAAPKQVSGPGSEHPFPLQNISRERRNNKDLGQDGRGRDQFQGRSASIPTGRSGRSASSNRVTSGSATSVQKMQPSSAGNGHCGQKLSQSTEDILSALR